MLKLFSVCRIACFPLTTRFMESGIMLPRILYWVIILAFSEILWSFAAFMIDLFLIRLLVILLTLSSQTNRWTISFWSGERYGSTDFRVCDFWMYPCFTSLLLRLSSLDKFNVFWWIIFAILPCFWTEVLDGLAGLILYFLLILKFFCAHDVFFGGPSAWLTKYKLI